MRTPVRFCCGVLLTTALTVFYTGSDRSSALAQTILTVTTNADSGAGSLRQAINDGNTDSPPVTINFAIPPFDGTVQTILLQTNLPPITNLLAINGFSESGSSPGTSPGTLMNNPVLLIALDGSLLGAGTATGLTFTVAGSVQGLTIQNFNGVGVSVTNSVTISENVISNSSIGVSCGDTNSLTGNFLVLNGTAIQLWGSSNTCTANVVTNNLNDGLDVFGGNNSVIGNLISANSSNGVDVASSTNTLANNIISTNSAAGIVIAGDNNSLSNDTISTNGADGVDILGSSNSLANSTISANLNVGVNVGAFPGITNYNNSLSGLTLSANGAGGLLLAGGTNTLAGSTISSNTGDGVVVSGSANVIGDQASGGNIIIGNTGNGIRIAGSVLLFPANANVVQGNAIGTDATGTNSLGNSQSGILIDGSLAPASTNLIGGESSGAGNTIAFNGSNGVTIVSNAVDNAIFENSIFTNAVLGIDLGADGVTPNHAFGVFPSGPNNFQNYPVLASATCSNGGVLVQGSITNSAAATAAHLEFFANVACDPAGFGQGQTFLGTADVTTDLSGGATFNAVFANVDLVDKFITATASDTSSNTSEFSACIPVLANQPPTISQCAASMTATADTNCEAVVPDFTSAVVVADNCTPTSDLVITQSPTNGTIAVLGTNTVTITVTDQAGLSTNCTTSFIVADTTPPQITCQSDITNSVGSSESSAVVTFPTPTASNTNNCAVTATVTCVPASGSIFPIGTTPVVCTAVDSAGNTASCTFNVTIQAPQQVIVDIAPGICPVVINTHAGGVIPVAIVGTESLNVTNIIPASVTLNGVLANTNFVFEDVASPFVYTHGCPKKKPDGIPDLVVEFDVNQLVASLGTVKNGEVKVLTVNGTMNVIGSNDVVVGTTTFEGQDKVKISTKKSPLPKGLKNPF